MPSHIKHMDKMHFSSHNFKHPIVSTFCWYKFYSAKFYLKKFKISLSRVELPNISSQTPVCHCNISNSGWWEVLKPVRSNVTIPTTSFLCSFFSQMMSCAVVIMTSFIIPFPSILNRDFKIGHYGRLGRLDAYTGAPGS